MKKTLLATAESLLAVVVAGLLSLVLFLAGGLAWWVVVEGRPLRESPWLRGIAEVPTHQDYRVRLGPQSSGAAGLEEVLAAVRGLGVARDVSLERQSGELALVVSGVDPEGFAAVRAVLIRHGYAPERFTVSRDPRPALPVLRPAFDGPPSLGMITAAIAVQTVVFGGLGLALARFRVRREEGVARFSAAGAAALGLVAGGIAVLGTIAISLLMDLAGLEVKEQDWVVELARSNPRSLLLLAPWTVIAGPLAEETLFRGYMFRFLGQQVGPGFGAAVSALAFAAVHLNPAALPIYVFYGLLLAAACRLTSRLLAPVVAHMFINLVSTVVLFLSAGELTV